MLFFLLIRICREVHLIEFVRIIFGSVCRLITEFNGNVVASLFLFRQAFDCFPQLFTTFQEIAFSEVLGPFVSFVLINRISDLHFQLFNLL